MSEGMQVALVGEVVVGSAWVVFISLEQQWQRVVVESILDKTVVVRSLDYGRSIKQPV